MEYLNMRLTQPLTHVHTELGKLEAHSTPARLSGHLREARSNMGATQVAIDIDSYPSRHAYGYTNNTDFAKEYEQKGFTGVQKGTSKHTSQAWENIDNGGKKGKNPVIEMYDKDLSGQIRKSRYIVAQHIPEPEIVVMPARLEGKPDPGDQTLDIETDAFAKTHFTPGDVDTEVTQKSDVRYWMTNGSYDKYI